MDGINHGHALSGWGIQNIVFACVDADRPHTSKYLNCFSHLPLHVQLLHVRCGSIVCWGFCLGLCWWPICILWGIAKSILLVRGQEEMERIRNHLDAVDIVFHKYWSLLCNYIVASFKSGCNSMTLTDLTNLDGGITLSNGRLTIPDRIANCFLVGSMYWLVAVDTVLQSCNPTRPKKSLCVELFSYISQC